MTSKNNYQDFQSEPDDNGLTNMLPDRENKKDGGEYIRKNKRIQGKIPKK